MTFEVYPCKSCNPNVTWRKVFLLCESCGMSDDSTETHYMDDDGIMWRVSSERCCQPVLASSFQVQRLTRSSEHEIMVRWERWRNATVAAHAKAD